MNATKQRALAGIFTVFKQKQAGIWREKFLTVSKHGLGSLSVIEQPNTSSNSSVVPWGLLWWQAENAVQWWKPYRQNLWIANIPRLLNLSWWKLPLSLSLWAAWSLDSFYTMSSSPCSHPQATDSGSELPLRWPLENNLCLPPPTHPLYPSCLGHITPPVINRSQWEVWTLTPWKTLKTESRGAGLLRLLMLVGWTPCLQGCEKFWRDWKMLWAVRAD